VPTEQDLTAAEEIEVVLTGGVRPVVPAPPRAPSPADLDRAHGPADGLGAYFEPEPGLTDQPE